jgi:leader peptidase (prepilin peptidase)/N-methyltransferase
MTAPFFSIIGKEGALCAWAGFPEGSALVATTIFAIGAVMGSFLNVCVYRIPRKGSILFPGSHCPICKHRIPFYDNIPVLSYLLLKGRCRYCKSPISFRYPLIELLTALAFLFAFVRFGFSVQLISYIVFFSLLIVVSFIDFDTETIPNKITILGMIIGLAISPFTISVLKSVLGLVTGMLALYLIALIGGFIFKKEAMGGGDIKLLAMIGAFLGPINVLIVLFIGSLIGAISGFIIKRRRIPFAPFLSIGGFIVSLLGDKILQVLGY